MAKRKNPVAVALAKRRMFKMTKQRRQEIAKGAAEARWRKHYDDKEMARRLAGAREKAS